MFSAMITNREFTGFTIHFINPGWMSHKKLLICEAVIFFMVHHNVMVYRFEIVYMIVFALETKMIKTRLTEKLCVTLTLRTLLYSTLADC